jgi:hypothetical protein
VFTRLGDGRFTAHRRARRYPDLRARIGARRVPPPMSVRSSALATELIPFTDDAQGGRSAFRPTAEKCDTPGGSIRRPESIQRLPPVGIAS